MGPLTALDIITLLLVGGGLVFGYLKGFVTEALSMIAWIAAIVALKLLHAPLSDFFAGPVGTWGGGAVLAFALIFLLVFTGGKLVAARIGGMTRSSLIGPFDRVLGAGFGALKGLIGATLLYLLASLVYDTIYGQSAERPAWMAQSRTYPLLNASGRAIVDFVEARRKGGATGQADNSQESQAEDGPGARK